MTSAPVGIISVDDKGIATPLGDGLHQTLTAKPKSGPTVRSLPSIVSTQFHEQDSR